MFRKATAAILSLIVVLTLFSACNLIDSGPAISRGTWSDGVYTNEFSKLQFVLPEGWVVATDEELANIIGAAADSFSDKEKWKAEAAKSTTIYDTLVQDPVTGNNIIIMYENLSLEIGGSKMSEEDYIKAVKKQAADAGTTGYTFNEPYYTKLNGVDYLAVRADDSNNVLTQYFVVHRVSKYMVCVVMTIVDDTDAADILAQFK